MHCGQRAIMSGHRYIGSALLLSNGYHVWSQVARWCFIARGLLRVVIGS